MRFICVATIYTQTEQKLHIRKPAIALSWLSSIMASLPIFPPILANSLLPSFPDDPQREQLEQRRPSWSSLALLADPVFNSYVPYAWGFTIYRVPFAGDSDERFTQALQRLTQWIKWLVRASRYSEEGTRDMFPGDVTAPIPPATDDPTDHLADRLFNQVIKLNIADARAVITEPKGSEDFSVIERAFSDWVATLGVDLALSKNNARYDHCLIIDENALKSIELLPKDLPPLEHRKLNNPNLRAVFASFCDSWVWVLDRKSNEAWLAGEKLEHPPWLRLRAYSFLELWFERAKVKTPLNWQKVREEDKLDWETVGWWNSSAGILNIAMQQVCEAGPLYSLW